MIGAQAAEQLLASLTGATLHRRGFRHKNVFYDCHTRMSDVVLMNCQIDPGYMMNLGLELATLDRGVYDNLMDVIKTEVDSMMPPGQAFGDAPFLADEDICPNLFKKLRATCLFGLIRNYMDPQKRSFLTLSQVYAEPMTSSTHVRVFLYVSVRLTMYDSTPGFRVRTPGHGSPLVPPALLDSSMRFGFGPVQKSCDSSYVGLSSGDSGMVCDNKDGQPGKRVVGSKRPLIVPDGSNSAASPILPEPPLMRRRLNFETTTLSGSLGVSRGRMNSTNGPLEDALDLTAPGRVAAVIDGGVVGDDSDGDTVPLLYGNVNDVIDEADKVDTHETASNINDLSSIAGDGPASNLSTAGHMEIGSDDGDFEAGRDVEQEESDNLDTSILTVRRQ